MVMNLSFRTWMEVGPLSGLEPPRQSPIDPQPAPGQTNAVADYHGPDSDQLPPTKIHKKKTMRK
jgi:hypothetical protein